MVLEMVLEIEDLMMRRSLCSRYPSCWE